MPSSFTARRRAVTLCACLAAGAIGGGVLAAAPAQALPVSPYDISAFAGTGTAGVATAGAATSSDLNLPYGVAVDSSGNVYIADLADYAVEKVTPGGTLSIIAGTPGIGGTPVNGPATTGQHLTSPTGIAVGPDGTVYVADYDASEVYEITTGGTLSIVAGNGSFHAPTPGPATSSALDEPYDVAVDSSGNLYIADAYNNELEKVTPSGTLSVFAGTGTAGASTPGPATSSRLSFPEGVAVDSAGNVYIADSNNNEVDKVTPSGTLSVVAGTGASGPPVAGPAVSSPVSDPGGVSVDAAGNLYIADAGNNDIEKVTPSGTLSVIAGDDSSGAPTYGGPATLSDLNYPEGRGQHLRRAPLHRRCQQQHDRSARAAGPRRASPPRRSPARRRSARRCRRRRRAYGPQNPCSTTCSGRTATRPGSTAPTSPVPGRPPTCRRRRTWVTRCV